MILPDPLKRRPKAVDRPFCGQTRRAARPYVGWTRNHRHTCPAVRRHPNRLRYQWQSRNTIAELRELPLGQVKIRGVVTFVDYPNKRFWMQDESGAIAINQDPGLIDARQGDVVFVEMKKTHAYDPTFGLPSLGLSDFKVNRRVRNAPLPVPEKAAIPTLSQKAKTGIRVTVEGVVHGAHPDGTGIVQLSLGDEGQEVQVFVPGDPHNFAQWLNARVRITGVLEVLLDGGGSPTSEIIWAQNATDLEKISNAPPSAEESSVRTLYADKNQISAHSVRLRGRVLYQRTPDQLLVEDESGVVSCGLEQPGNFAAGTPVEVLGFLKKDGLRIDLVHAAVTPILAHDLPQFPSKSAVTTIAGVRALSGSIIRTAPPVKVTGVVTYVNTLYRQLFLQDSTGGIFVKYPDTPVELYQGEKITVTGLANEGDFAPVIVAPKFTSLGPASLPTPALMNMRAETGVLDSLYSQFEGIVHPTRGKPYSTKQTTFDLYTSFGPVHVGVMEHPTQDNFMADLQDATVRVRGVAGEVFNSRKQLVGLQLAVQNMKGIEVIEPGSSNPFAIPATAIGNLLSYAPHTRFDHRVVVSGTATMLGDGFFYIQDQTGGVRIESGTSGLHLNDVIDAAGYAKAAAYSPMLTDAVVRVRSTASAVTPQPVYCRHVERWALRLPTGQHRGNSAQCRKLRRPENSVRYIGWAHVPGRPLSHRHRPVLIPPQEGSVLRLTGICSVEVGRGNIRQSAEQRPGFIQTR